MADQEHYDFHYQPTGSGAISGQQVLEQTEDAINELGDYVYDNVGGAMDVAQEALETAQNAEQDAQTALDTANSFSSAIQSAQQDASTALSTAQTAQTTATNANATATNANATAIQASQDASSAVTTANNASGQVSTLSGTVTALGQRVTTAEGNIGQNTSDITALTTRVGTAEGNITTLQNDVSIAQSNASSAMATAGTVKQQSYVLRYSSTTLVASSTNSNTLLDNTDNLKVGDKVLDSSGNIYVVTAIDTANSTFTIGTSLIDLAQDSDVVHKSGDETVSGTKTFDSNTYVYNSDNTATTPNLYLRSSKIEISSQGNTSGDQNLTYLDKNNTTYAYVKGAIQSNGSAVKICTIAKDSSDNSVVNELQILAYTNGNKAIFPTYSNETDLGVSNYKWKSIFATNYYYGNDNVEFSQKFVTTDTAQTVSGNKTFSSINGVEPSSLGMPDLDNGIDISSYFDISLYTGQTYTPPANGWISFSITSSARGSILCEATGISQAAYSVVDPDANNKYRVSILIPCQKNQTLTTYIRASSGTVNFAKFYPCQGNV